MRNALLANGIALTAAALLAAAAPASASTGIMDIDATFLVGVDIQPGVYTTTTAATVCAWARLNAITPDVTAILESGGAINGKVTVEIKSTDIAFYTAGCGTWKLKTTTTTGSGGSGSFGSTGSS
ncbi:hypothetical protein ABZ319_12150 [Nocardia sp. NPDC005978]|uniref:hypothetical protein n=1 Tax=Nocardia sp. NPDC005978 TaxID=3156725 RepID=UPI0033A4E31F